MKLELFKKAMLKEDIKKYRLKKADIVTLVEHIPANGKTPEGYGIEVFNVLNETIGVYFVAASKLEAVNSNIVYTGRKLRKAS